MALVVGLRLFCQFAGDALKRLVLKPDLETGQRRSLAILGSLHHHLAAHLQVGARRAVEEARIDINLRHLAGAQRLLFGAERHIEALGHIIFHEESRLANCRAFRVGIGLNPPGAARRAIQQSERIGAPAKALILNLHALVFNAVGAFCNNCQRQAGNRKALGVAQQRADKHCLAGAVDAAFRIDKCVERFCRRAALDATVRQVKTRLRLIEEIIVAFRIGCGDHAGRHAASAA